MYSKGCLFVKGRVLTYDHEPKLLVRSGPLGHNNGLGREFANVQSSSSLDDLNF